MNDYKKYVLSLIRQMILFIITLVLLCFGMCIMFWIVCSYDSSVENTIQEFPKEQETIVKTKVVKGIPNGNQEYASLKVFDLIEIIDYNTLAKNEYFAKMLELECGDVDKEQWFIEYKQILTTYSDYLDIPETIYDKFTSDEIYLIHRCIETEVYQCGFDAKVNIASVILNRYRDGRFGNTITKIITNPGQFAYHRTNISESTKLALEFAYIFGDTTNGCLAFRSDCKPNKWGKWVYEFSDDAVHHFYKENEG